MRTTTINRLQRYGTRRNSGALDLGPLRLTALSYLAEARAQENYEQMGEILRYASEFGAKENDLQVVLGL